MLNIVVVDDEAKIRKGITNLINKSGNWQVTGSFEKPEDALAFLEEHPPDVVVTDIKMPGMSGLELIKKIQQVSADIVIVILSGYSDFSYAQKAIELGIYRYLTKPTDTKEFIQVLEGIEKELEDREEEQDEVDNLTISTVLSYIDENYGEKLGLVEIADSVYISPSYLSRLFKKHMGKNLNEYILEYRMEKAKGYLKNARYNITEIAHLVGYTDTKYFSSSFKKVCGVSPLIYRNKK